MRLVIPNSLKNKEVFKIVADIFNQSTATSMDFNRVPDVIPVWDLIEFMKPEMSKEDKLFIYNLFISQKGLYQVSNSIANYLGFELSEFIVEKDSIISIVIDTISTEDLSQFLDLFKKSLDALIFYNKVNFGIENLEMVLNTYVLKSVTTFMDLPSSYNSINPANTNIKSWIID